MTKSILLLGLCLTMSAGCSTLGQTSEVSAAEDALNTAKTVSAVTQAGGVAGDAITYGANTYGTVANSTDAYGNAVTSASSGYNAAASGVTSAATSTGSSISAVAGLTGGVNATGGDAIVRSATDAACVRVYENYAALKAAGGATSETASSGGWLSKIKGTMTAASALTGIAGVASGGSTVATMSAASMGLNGVSNLISMFDKSDASNVSGIGSVNVDEVTISKAVSLNCPVGPLTGAL